VRIFGDLIGFTALNWGLRQVEPSARESTLEVILFCSIKLLVTTSVHIHVGVCGRWCTWICVLWVHFNGSRPHCGRNSKGRVSDTATHGRLLHELHVWTALDKLKSLLLVPVPALADHDNACNADSDTNYNGNDQNSYELIDGLLDRVIDIFVHLWNLTSDCAELVYGACFLVLFLALDQGVDLLFESSILGLLRFHLLKQFVELVRFIVQIFLLHFLFLFLLIILTQEVVEHILQLFELLVFFLHLIKQIEHVLVQFFNFVFEWIVYLLSVELIKHRLDVRQVVLLLFSEHLIKAIE